MSELTDLLTAAHAQQVTYHLDYRRGEWELRLQFPHTLPADERHPYGFDVDGLAISVNGYRDSAYDYSACWGPGGPLFDITSITAHALIRGGQAKAYRWWNTRIQEMEAREMLAEADEFKTNLTDEGVA